MNAGSVEEIPMPLQDVYNDSEVFSDAPEDESMPGLAPRFATDQAIEEESSDDDSDDSIPSMRSAYELSMERDLFDDSSSDDGYLAPSMPSASTRIPLESSRCTAYQHSPPRTQVPYSADSSLPNAIDCSLRSYE